MIENDASGPEDPQARPPSASNDNGARGAPIDPRILTIARALGRQIAREYLKRLRAANDNEPAQTAGELRATLEAAGTPIGPYDLLIAAQALRTGATLVTANLSEFARVPGLNWQDWTAKS